MSIHYNPLNIFLKHIEFDRFIKQTYAMHLEASGRSRLPRTLRLQSNCLGQDMRCKKLQKY